MTIIFTFIKETLYQGSNRDKKMYQYALILHVMNKNKNGEQYFYAFTEIVFHRKSIILKDM